MGEAEDGPEAAADRRRGDSGTQPSPPARRRILRHADDDALLSWARDGEREAFAELYRRHHCELGRYARGLSRRLLHHDVGEDVVAESIRKTLLALHNGNGPTDSFLKYAYTCVRAVIYTHARRQQDEPLEALPDTGVDTSDDVLERIAAWQALGALPPRWQQTVWATKVAGLGATDLAELLGISANSASVLASRAREGLRIAYVRTQLPTTTDQPCAAVLDALARRVVTPVSDTHARLIRQHTKACNRCSTAADALQHQLDLPWSDARTAARRAAVLAS